MRRISFSADVHAPLETLWKLLLDRVEYPNEYLPGTEEVRIVERHGEVLIREVRAHGLAIRERVTLDKGKGEVRYLLLEHPLFSGTVTHRVVPFSRQSPVSPVRLSTVVLWAPENEGAEWIIVKSMPSAIQREVMSIKEEAEAA